MTVRKRFAWRFFYVFVFFFPFLQFDARYEARLQRCWCWQGLEGKGGECSLVDIRGRKGGVYMGPYPSKPPPCCNGALIYVSWVLDSHYAGRRLSGCRRCEGRPLPRAKNTGVECECISNAFATCREKNGHESRRVSARRSPTNHTLWTLFFTFWHIKTNSFSY